MAKYMDKDIGARGVDPHVYAMGEASYKHDPSVVLPEDHFYQENNVVV